jgi:hypothetical protein
MPTGYTAAVCDGNQSFEEFVWTAVRACGVFIHMRDDSLTARLRMPEKDFSQSGSPEKIAKREADIREEERDLRDVESRTTAEVETAFATYKAEALADYAESYERVLPVYERLTQMRSQVADWTPPTAEHEDFKKFLLSQLDDGLKWDGRLPEKPEFEPTAKAWQANEIDWRKRRIARSNELLEEEKNRPDQYVDHTKWILDLVNSVPPPAGRFAPGEIKKARTA